MGRVINFYNLPKVQKYITKYDNPNYDFDTMPLKHPMRMVICGCSGSGKSNVLLNIINLMNNTYEKIIIFTQDKDEPLYQYLEEELDDGIEIYEGIKNVKDYDFNDFEDMQVLIIFDDMCVEKDKDQQKIGELFIRGRKMAQGRGISVIYLTQSYFQTLPIIRKQMTGLILIKVNGKRDLGFILKEQSLGATKEQLYNMYKACTTSIKNDKDKILNFLYIDLNATEESRFRYKFDKIIDINDF
jgi:ABC-type dipeptide/oligopeptide/nickel transport system ATPase component